LAVVNGQVDLATDYDRNRNSMIETGRIPAFALVARDLLSKRPIDAIPLATRIASATVEAFEQR
jgi:hypothetical protein